MNFRKHNGKIYKVELSPAEKRAMDEEINRQLIEKHQEFTDDVDYMIMRILHDQFGFGLTRLKRFYEAFMADNDALVKHYEMPDAGVYIARKEMNAIGCNIEEWNRERSE
jgi:hypothetical protein